MKPLLDNPELNSIISSIELSEELNKLADTSIEDYDALYFDYEEVGEEDENEEASDEEKDARKTFEDKTDDFDTIDIFKQYLSELGEFEPLSDEQEKALFAIYVEGGPNAEDARESILNSSLRLPVYWASKYSGRGAPILDLIQEGNVGLLKAFDKFSPSMGYKFSTYATYWIKNEISEFLRKCNTHGSIPREAYQLMGRIRKAEVALMNNLNRKPTRDEIAVFIDESVDKVNYAYKYAVREMSINQKYGNDNSDEPSPLERIASDFIVTPYDKCEAAEIHRIARKALETLSERERTAVILNLGIGCKKMSKEEISKLPQFRITPQRVGQIIKGAIKKLKSQPELIDALRGLDC